MTLTLHYHPLSSFCQKALIGLYELEVPFTKNIVDLFDAEERARLLALWPIGKFPVLYDEAHGITVPESTVILEHIDPTGRLLPSDRDHRRECRIRDRVFDLYLNVPLGKVVTDKLRPEGARDPHGVAEARAMIERAYRLADSWLTEGSWAVGDTFTIADCAAAPALFYATRVVPLGSDHAELARYFGRLEKRPSVARVFAEAAPYMASFPG